VGKIRTIKPEFFTNELLFDAEKKTGLPVRLFFAGLLTQTDEAGRFEWRPRTLKAAILPFDDVDAEPMLMALRDIGTVEHYTIHGREYGWICSLSRHQLWNHRERASDIPPAPSDPFPTRESRETAHKENRFPKGKERDSARVDTDSRVNEYEGTREPRVQQGRERKGRERNGTGRE
jgi:hypothetical protein